MSNHRAMKELAENPAAIRALARHLLLIEPPPGSPTAWTDWELDFLDDMAQRSSAEPLSERQREKLWQLKSNAERHGTIDGFNVADLIARAWEARLDLDDEDDERFIDDLHASGTRTVTGGQRWRLLRICRDLGVVDAHHAPV